MAILLRDNSISKPVMDLIYEKQLEFRKEKNRMVSLEKTIERLIKDAYLKDEKEKK